MDVETLEGVRFFSGLSKEELERVAQWTDEVSVPESYALVREGDFAHEFFVIEEGTAAVTHDGAVLAELGSGDFFGEIGLVRTRWRTASVVASTPMRVIVMDEPSFRQMKREMPAVADRIEAAIHARLDG